MSSFYHLGFKKPVKRSTISYVNQQHSSDLFQALYYQLLSELKPSVRKATEKPLFCLQI